MFISTRDLTKTMIKIFVDFCFKSGILVSVLFDG